MTDKLIEQIKADREAWWRPTRTDDAWLARLRRDYPENAHMSDDNLRDYYDGYQAFATTWDHVGDAYAEYEPLAEQFIEYESRILADAEVIKAAEELAEAVRHEREMVRQHIWTQVAANQAVDDALAAFRQAQARAALEENNDDE